MEKKRGRPSKYKPEYAAQARSLCELGATDADLARSFGVSDSTFALWKTQYPELSEALKTGKDIADERVERSLYQKAVGYRQDAVKIFMPAGSKTPVIAKYEEVVAPDTTAAIFWLKNRRKEQWRDKVDHEHTGKDGGPIETKDLSANDVARRVAFLLAQGINHGSDGNSEGS